MSVFIGDRVSLGIGKETTRGTGAAAAFWLPAVTFDFQQVIHKEDIKGAFGKLVGTEDSKTVRKHGAGTIGADVRANALGYFLAQLFGSWVDSTVSGASSHLFTLTQSNSHPSLSLTIKDPNKCERFVRAVLQKLTLKASPDAVATMEMDFVSDVPGDTTATPSFTTQDYVFAPNTITFKLSDTQANLGAASAISVNNLELVFQKTADPDFGLGTVSVVDIYNTDLVITGSFELIFAADTYHDYVFSSTQRALRLTMSDSSVTIGSNNPSLTFDLYNVEFVDFKRTIELGKIARQTVSFKAHLNLSDGNIMTATLVNNKATYDA